MFKINVAIYQFATSSIHLAASLEILYKENLSGNNTSYCLWGQKTYFPTRMAVSGESIFGIPPRRYKKLIRKASPNVNFESNFVFDREWVESMLNIFTNQLKLIKNISDLSSLKYKDINPGAALANEITSISKSSELNLHTHKKIMIIILRSYLEIFSAVTMHIKSNNIKRVHVYNGRFLHERAAWDAGKILKCEVIIFETTRNRYQQRIEGFHDRENNQVVMKQIWKDSNFTESEKVAIASKWFDEMRSDLNPFKIRNAKYYQNPKKFFVYYSNSDDEIVGFWEKWNEPLGSQYDCVLRLIEIFSKQEKYELVIRLHPNLINKPISSITKWQFIPTRNNSHVILPGEEISSYDLLEKSIGSITFGSTIGIESAYYSKPVLVLADTKFDELGIADKPKSWDEVEDWLRTAENLSPATLYDRKINSCIFGFYLDQCGNIFPNTLLEETGKQGAWNAVSFLKFGIHENRIKFSYRKIVSKYKFWKFRNELSFE